jgi:transposase
MSEKLTDLEKKRLKVIRLHGEGHSQGAIQRKLGVSPKFIKNTLNRFNETGGVKDRPRSGRPQRLSSEDKKRLVKAVKGRERQSLRKTAATFKTVKSGRVGKSTVENVLKTEGLIPHRKKKRPKLTATQKAKRVEFATEFRRKDWANTAFWDEKLFELSHPSNPKNDVVWDKRGAEYFKEEEKYPEKIMVGVAITAKGVTRLVIYKGTVDAQKFIDNLQGPIDDINKLYPDRNWEWVMDKARIHTAKLTVDWMRGKVPSLFPSKKWPANSPDLSAIENLFGYVQDIVDQKIRRTSRV